MATWQSSLTLLTITAVLVTSVPVDATHEDGTSASIRVRSPDPSVRRLIEEGAKRSATFRELLGRLNRTPWLVYIQRGQCPQAIAIGCLMHVVAHFEGAPYLRIFLDNRRRSPELEIEVIAHELCHALEAAESPGVIDTASLVAFFQRTARKTFESHRVTTFETRAAVETGNRVARELQR
ncbi:MAG TPA: hypothetical protein VKE51_14490 [Vicinamibacterales bacterium]|nr:hypothetical protein [Vicinamibacterales bacterium]